MNPNQAALMRRAEEKLKTNLQMPIEELKKVRLLDLPILSFKDGMAEVYGQIEPDGDYHHLSSDWAGLVVMVSEGKNSFWLLCKDEVTGEKEFLCLGAPKTVEEGLNKALSLIHTNMISAPCQSREAAAC